MLAGTSYKLFLRLRDSLTSFNKDDSANIFGEKDVQ